MSAIRPTETVTEDETAGEKIVAECEMCGHETNHLVRKSVETHDGSDELDIHQGASFQIIECAGCGWISFRQAWWSSEVRDAVESPEGGLLWSDPVQYVLLFPSRKKGIWRLDHEHYLPPTIRQLYNEKMFALTNEQPILAGIGIRALVEAVCVHYGATKRNLVDRIDEIAAEGKISKDQREALHGCRCLGNDAAHRASVPTDEELQIANDISDSLLKAAFIHPHLRERLPKDKTRKPKVPPVAPGGQTPPAS